MMAYGDVDLEVMEMVTAEEYYRKKKRKVIYRAPNKLVTKAEGALLNTVYDDTAFTFHSGTGLVVQNHLNYVSVTEALLDEDNWLISEKTGEYAFAKLDASNTAPLTPEREIADFRALHTRFVKILQQANGRDYEGMLPSDLKDFLSKLLAEDLKVQHILCHSFFLPSLSRFLLRILLDVKLKRPLLTGDCQRRDNIRKMFMEMPYVDEDGDRLREIVGKNVFLSSWQRHIDEEKARWSLIEPDKTQRTVDPKIQVAGRLIGLQRAGCLHYHKPNLPEGCEGLLQGINIDKVIRMMNVEFPKFEQRVLELLARHGLWDHLEIIKLFGKYAARIQEVIERDKLRPAEKAAKAAEAHQ